MSKAHEGFENRMKEARGGSKKAIPLSVHTRRRDREERENEKRKGENMKVGHLLPS